MSNLDLDYWKNDREEQTKGSAQPRPHKIEVPWNAPQYAKDMDRRLERLEQFINQIAAYMATFDDPAEAMVAIKQVFKNLNL
jgi:hypothetical protein